MLQIDCSIYEAITEDCEVFITSEIIMFEDLVRKAVAHSKAYNLTDCQHRILIDCILEEFNGKETVDISASLEKLGFTIESEENSEMSFSNFFLRLQSV